MRALTTDVLRIVFKGEGGTSRIHHIFRGHLLIKKEKNKTFSKTEFETFYCRLLRSS